MAQKKLMLLGGLSYLIPVIEAAHEQGYYVITADYLPNNIAHRYSDEYCNVNVVDKDAVLKAARELNIDGIMSFAVDPGVVAAGYVQNCMNLPSFGPFESINILQHKDLFRKFLADNGFNVPKAKGYNSYDDALSDTDWYTWPMIVKPTDSAGSKGVTKITSVDQLPEALRYAFDNSISGTIIVEEYIEQRGCSSDSECFSVNGELKFVSFSSQRFDRNAENPNTPSAYSWPSTYTTEEEEYLRGELQRLIRLLGMKTSIYNVETRVSANGIPFIMEVSPRGGGNRLAEMLRLATGTDLITACVRAAVGDSFEEIQPCRYNGCWAEVILHSDHEGIFEGVEIDEKFRKNLVELNLLVNEGDKVLPFSGANLSLGTAVMRFDTPEEMNVAMEDIPSWIRIKTK